MKTGKITWLLSLGLLFLHSAPPGGFKAAQLQYPRVKEAYREKETVVQRLFTAQGLTWNRAQLFIRVFKREGQLELWAKGAGQPTYRLIQTYVICAPSGGPGPKRKAGDRQVPEGFYVIDRFNPSSNFHLSLGIDYPNAVDRQRAGKEDAGGAIFIHGDCVTIGCVPLTDAKIQELYIAVVEARNGGQLRVPVHIFPARMHGVAWQQLQQAYATRTDLLSFWENLQPGYDWFQTRKHPPRTRITPEGRYAYF